MKKLRDPKGLCGEAAQYAWEEQQEKNMKYYMVLITPSDAEDCEMASLLMWIRLPKRMPPRELAEKFRDDFSEFAERALGLNKEAQKCCVGANEVGCNYCPKCGTKVSSLQITDEASRKAHAANFFLSVYRGSYDTSSSFFRFMEQHGWLATYPDTTNGVYDLADMYRFIQGERVGTFRFIEARK